MAKGQMFAEGELVKRYYISYGGETLGSWDTAIEAMKEYKSHLDVVRPVIDPNHKFDYRFYDRRTEFTSDRLRMAAVAEETSAKKAD